MRPPLLGQRAGAALVGLVALVYRLDRPFFHNDHFVHLSRARQIFHGDLPIRDFVDPGLFLQYWLSFAMEWLLGHRLLGEALLCGGLIALGAALTFLAARQLAGSTPIALLTALVVTAATPRLYSYPKLFLYPLALLVLWRAIDVPSRARVGVLALLTAVAFLFRHDHGAYLALGSLAGLAGVRPRALAIRRVALYGAVLTVAVCPFLLFLHLNGGVLSYGRAALEFGVSERSERRRTDARWPAFGLRTDVRPLMSEINVRWRPGVDPRTREELQARHALLEPRLDRDDPTARTWVYRVTPRSSTEVAALVQDPAVEDTHRVDRVRYRILPDPDAPTFTAWQWRWPALGPFHDALRRWAEPNNATAWLFYLVLATPWIAAVVALGPASAGSPLSFRAKVLGATVLAAAAQLSLLRGPEFHRVADASPVPAVLGTWLLVRLAGADESGKKDLVAAFRRAGAAMVAGMTVFATMIAAEASPEHLWRTGSRQTRLEALRSLAATPPIESWAPPGSVGLRHLARYIRDCTVPASRVLVTWFEPQVYYYADRPFAGGHVFFIPGLATSGAEQEQTVRRLSARPPAVVLGQAGKHEEFEAAFPSVAAWVRERYVRVAESSFGDPPLRYILFLPRGHAAAVRYPGPELTLIPCPAARTRSAPGSSEDPVPGEASLAVRAAALIM